MGELELLSRVPAGEWTEGEQLTADERVSQEYIDTLVARGLLISGADDPVAARLRLREETFASNQWHPYAAFYNLMIKRPNGLDKSKREIYDVAAVAAGSYNATDRFVARYGEPPPVFHQVPGEDLSVELPRVEKEGGLYSALAERKTVRAFDAGTPLRVEDLATVLYYVFRRHGYTHLTQGVPVLHKTSPSGGSLHAVEVYPLVLNASGIDTGLYHYQVRDHSLSRIQLLEHWEAEAMALGMAAGQDFAAAAHVVLLMTARFGRNFWKYRKNVRTHSVVLQDAAHLSQTFYLVCADLGLGCFYAAFDGPFVEEALGLDGISEGAVALVGLGSRLQEGIDYCLDFFPYTPGETEI